MNVQLVKEFLIEAAHRNTTATGPGERLHGHTFRIEVIVEGEVDPRLGWLIDYGDIKEAFGPLHNQLDHRYLNEIEGMNAASLSDIAAWIQERLALKLPGLKGVRVSTVGDNAFVPVELAADPDRDLPQRIGFTFEAAQRLPNLPDGHPCRNLHGHTYRVEVGAADLARLERPLESIYETFDHRCLNDIPGLDDATSERLCAWIWDKLSNAIDDLEVVIVQETATARCIYHGK
jgi:6-pyruvoyltetrahydropterin/6-carboxytetrahydropterin synthase